jgi:hypothetical protein
MYFLLAIAIVAWIVSTLVSVGALVMALVAPSRRFRLVLALASIGMFVGYLGFGRWTPFSFFPQIGYTWTNDDFRISLASGWFFLAPLVLGTVSLLLAIAKRRE